jgi:hypothetical protein
VNTIQTNNLRARSVSCAVNRKLFAAALVLCSSPLLAGPLAIAPAEKLQYSWSLKGPLRFIARLALPTSGAGTLETSSSDGVRSRLTMKAPGEPGYAFYESRMTSDGTRTLTSADGYTWGKRSEEQQVTFDYRQGVAHIRKNSSEEGVETKVRKLGADAPQDVLTSIFYLRRNADAITSPRQAQVYSGGKPYTFLFTPQPVGSLRIGNEMVRVRPFTITPLSPEKKGAVRVWFSDDERRLPMRIEIDQKFATLKLDLRNR